MPIDSGACVAVCRPFHVTAPCLPMNAPLSSSATTLPSSLSTKILACACSKGCIHEITHGCRADPVNTEKGLGEAVNLAVISGRSISIEFTVPGVLPDASVLVDQSDAAVCMDCGTRFSSERPFAVANTELCQDLL